MDDPVAVEVLERFQRAETSRRPFEQNWQQLRELVRPGTSDFNRMTTPGQVKNNIAFDGTAPKANGELASALIGYLVSPVTRWFDLEIESVEGLDDEDSLLWLDEVSDVIYRAYGDIRSNFNTAMHEAFLDIGAFGTCAPSQEWDEDGHLVFRAHALSSIYVLENAKSRVDVVFRKLSYTTRQMVQEFPDLPRIIREEKNPDKEWLVIHAVFPRTDRDYTKFDRGNMPYASCWVSVEAKEVLRQSGYLSLPYHVARWTKLAEEVYGRGPGIDCLPDIKMLNKMEEVLIKAGQKAVDPPLQVPDDGFLLPIKTSPGSIIFKDPSAPEIVPLEHRGNLPFGLDQANQKREFIKMCFFIDWIRMEKNDVEMTAYEVQDRRDEKLRLLSPMFGRLMSELLGPLIARSYELLRRANRFPEAPGRLAGTKLRVHYTSPAARAQRMLRANGMDQYIQGLVPMVQLSPQVMDVVDMDAYAREKAILQGTPRVILRTKQQIQEMRDQRQKDQAINTMVQAAEPVTKSIKNLADAKEKGMGLSDLT